MIRAWRREFFAVVVMALAILLLGQILGRPQLLLTLALVGYLCWHLMNLFYLQLWIAHRKGRRLPVSLGVWEAVFDGLQSEQLRRRRQRHRLIAHLSDYRTAAELLPDALVVLSQAGAIRWFNSAARKFLGLRSRTDLARDIREVLPHPVLDDDLAQGHSSNPLEMPSPVNGAWVLSVQLTAPFGNQGERLLVARDVTASFRLEQARKDFLASVSHELRTPITVFRGYLEALQDVAAGHSEWRKPVSHMDQQARHMQALVDDLLLLSRLEMGDRPRSEDLVPVPDMLVDIVAEARTLSGARRHDFCLRVDPEVCLKGEEADLYSAFSNLIFNAVRHTPPGTQVRIDWQENADGARFSVQDFGPGISAQHLPRLTERFYLVESGRSRRTGGTGLGLAIVKQVLDRYTAELSINSTPGQGSTFSCQFPEVLVEKRLVPVLSKAG